MHDFATRRHRTTDDVHASELPVVQRKLRVGAVDDPAEREADMVADCVMAALDATSQPASLPRAADQTAGTAGRIARSAMAGSRDATPVAEDTAGRIHRMSGRGSALPAPMRRSMEHAFGADFSNVRLHRGADSARLNDELSARAFTSGSDVFLGRSVDTNSREGTRLMAHELTHVVQQGGTAVRRCALGDDVIHRAPGKGGGNGTKKAALSDISESGHWNHSRDAEHSEGKDAIYRADESGMKVSKKLYARHSAKDTALITTFKTNRENTFVVVGSFADVSSGRLTYDTAYLSKTPAVPGVKGKTYYSPLEPIIEL